MDKAESGHLLNLSRELTLTSTVEMVRKTWTALFTCGVVSGHAALASGFRSQNTSSGYGCQALGESGPSLK